MPVDGDPYEALLDDDPDRARLALARLRLSDMDRTICAGIAYIYREAFLSEAFFKVWASDVLVTFHHFSVAAPGGPARELASRAASAWRGTGWSSTRRCPRGAARRTCCSSTRDATRSARWACRTSVSASSSCPTSRGSPRTSITAWTYPRRRRARARVAASAGEPDFAKLTVALIWSYFFEAAGVENELVGDTADDVRRACEREVDMRAELHPRTFRAAPRFRAHAYFVTHKIFTATSWCRFRLRREDWRREREFLLAHLAHARRDMKRGSGDVHLVGEFVQAASLFRR